MSEVPNKFVLASEVVLQTRKAHAVDSQFAAAVRRTCEASPHLASCYILDARKPDAGDVVLVIAVTLDDEAAQMDSVALQFQEMLREFPIQARRTFIMSSTRFADIYMGTEFYTRGEAEP